MSMFRVMVTLVAYLGAAIVFFSLFFHVTQNASLSSSTLILMNPTYLCSPFF